MNTRHSIAVAILLCSLAVMAFAAKIKADHDASVDFSQYRTYAWGNNLAPTRQAAGMVIGYAVDHQLKLRGLEQTDAEHADLIVRYTAVGDTDLNFGAADPMFAVVGGAPLPGSTIWTPGFAVPTGGRYLKKGSLVVDIFDFQHKRLIWSAIATDTIDPRTQKAIEQINKIVATMFSHYPVAVPSRAKTGN